MSSVVVSEFSSETICRGELSAVISRLMSKSVCEAGGNGSEELKKCPPPSPAVQWLVNIRERKFP